MGASIKGTRAPSNRRPPRRARPRKRCLPSFIVALGTGLALVSLAIPHTLAAFAGLPARPVIDELRAGNPVPPRYVATAIDYQRAMLRSGENGRAMADLALLFEAADRPAGDIYRRSLALSPAQPFVWTALLHYEIRQGNTGLAETGLDGGGLGALLERSIAVAPSDRRLTFERLELGILAWRRLDPRIQEIVAREVRVAARLDSRRVAAIAKRRFATGIVRGALAGEPELGRAVDAALLTL